MPAAFPGNSTTKLARSDGAGGFESAIEAGAPALTRGTPALSFSIAELSRDAEVTVSTDGTYDFGSVGPELVIMFDATMINGSGNVIPILGPNSVVTKGDLAVEDVPAMPGGKGMVFAKTLGSYGVQTVPHTRGFEARTWYFPQAHQDNSKADLWVQPPDKPPKWQIKPIWNMADFDFTSTDTNFYFVAGNSFYVPTGEVTSPDDSAWNTGTLQTGNSVATNYTGSIVTQGATTEPRNYPLDEPYLSEFLYDQGDVSTTGTASLQEIVCSPSQGPHHAKQTKTGTTLHKTTGATKIINSFTYPGYLLGFSVPENKYVYEGEMYKTAGDGAACRIAITDTADYYMASKRTILEPVRDQWSNTQAKSKLRGGWWDLNDLAGKYLCIIGADNEQIGTGVQL